MAAVAVIAMGAAVLLGWTFKLNVLIRIWPGIPPTKANAALMLVVAGAGLLSLSQLVPGRSGRLCAAIASGFCVILSALTLLEYAWRGFGIDQLLTRDSSGSELPGRPSPHAAVGLLLAGANLLMLAELRSHRGRQVAASINNALALVVVAGIIGYAYNVGYLRGFSAVNGIGVVALTALAVLVAALAALEPDGTWLEVFVSPGAGGRMARRFAPLVLLMPILIGVQVRPLRPPARASDGGSGDHGRHRGRALQRRLRARQGRGAAEGSRRPAPDLFTL